MDDDQLGGEAWAYDLNDGAPVNDSLHGGYVIRDAPDGSSAGRRPFGDVTSNFSDFYTSLLASAAAEDMKSPDRTRRWAGTRFSPNRVGPCAAAKRLWSKDLPPLPKQASVQQPPKLMHVPTLPEDGSSSPTRHSSRVVPIVQDCGPHAHCNDTKQQYAKDQLKATQAPSTTAEMHKAAMQVQHKTLEAQSAVTFFVPPMALAVAGVPSGEAADMQLDEEPFTEGEADENVPTG